MNTCQTENEKPARRRNERRGRPLGSKDRQPRKRSVCKPRASGQTIAMEFERDEDEAGASGTCGEYMSFKDASGNMATLRFASSAEKNKAIEAATRNHSARHAVDEDEREHVVGDMLVTSAKDRLKLRAIQEAILFCCGPSGAEEIEKEAKKRMEARNGH